MYSLKIRLDIANLQRPIKTYIYEHPNAVLPAAVAEWYRYRTVACFVTGSSPVPLKTRRVGQRCMLNLSRSETSSGVIQPNQRERERDLNSRAP
ncbi:hypothetical protein TNCV_2782431 [Trichonephila clavipes]|nr:hypothetical protein TNCV_2782431 [Trichonephila clavipes]